MAKTIIHPRLVEPRGRINLLDNGQFDIWQRGTSINVGNTSKSADRWYNHQYTLAGGSPTYTVTRDTDVPAYADCGAMNMYSMKYAVNVPHTAGGSDDRFAACFQMLFGKEMRNLCMPGKKLTLSFWVKATKAGTYSCSLGAQASWSTLMQYTISSAATWEKKVLTFDSPQALGGGLNYPNFYWFIEAFKIRFNFNTTGSSFSDVSENPVWAGNTNYGKPGETYWGETLGNYMKFAQVQFEEGPEASTYDTCSSETELERCEKHFQKSYAYEEAPGTVIGSVRLRYPGCFQSTATSDSWIWVPYPKKMMFAASATIYSPVSGTANNVTTYKVAGAPNPQELGWSMIQGRETGFLINLGWGDECWMGGLEWTAETGW